MQCQQGWHNPTQTLLTKVNATVLDTVHFVTSSAFARFCAGSALTEVTNATASVKSDKASMIWARRNRLGVQWVKKKNGTEQGVNVEIFCTLIARDIEAVIQMNQIGPQKVTQNEALTPLGLMSYPGTALNKDPR